MKKGNIIKWLILGIVVIAVVIAVSMRSYFFEAVEILKTPDFSTSLEPEEYFQKIIMLMAEQIEKLDNLGLKSASNLSREDKRYIFEEGYKLKESFHRKLKNIKPPKSCEKIHNLHKKHVQLDTLYGKYIIMGKKKEGIQSMIQCSIVEREYYMALKEYPGKEPSLLVLTNNIDELIKLTYEDEEQWRDRARNLE